MRMIKKNYPQIYYFKESNFSISGIPDLICSINGYFVAIELKTPTGKVSKIQEYTMEQIRKSGGKAFVARSVENVRNCINLVLDNAK